MNKAAVRNGLDPSAVPRMSILQLLYDQKSPLQGLFSHLSNHWGSLYFHDDLSISHVDYNRKSFRLPTRFTEIIKNNGGCTEHGMRFAAR